MLKEIVITMSATQIYLGIITILLGTITLLSTIIGGLFKREVKNLDEFLKKIEEKIDNLVSKSELQTEIKLLENTFQGKIDLIQKDINQIKKQKTGAK
jgi:predicted PurR-regulated permease PerM